MASLNTYARLIKPPMFKPEEEVRFKLQHSDDLMLLYGTLVIDEYLEEDFPEAEWSYTGTKVTKLMQWGIAGQGYDEFVIPGGTLGRTPDPHDSNIRLEGKMNAHVEFGSELENGHVINPVFVSNTVLCDMLIMWDNDFRLLGAPYTATGSVFAVEAEHQPRHDFGTYGSTDIQSYRFYLYDSTYRLIEDSGELYTWDTNILGNARYRFKNLQDNTTYYVRAKGTLNGGYTLYTSYAQLSVSYDDTPVVSENMELNSVTDGVKIDLDLTGITHNKVIISRTEKYVDNYLELARITNSDDILTYTDGYAIPEKTYIYKAVIMNGDTIADTLYSEITHKSNCIVISDIYGTYTAIGDMTKHPISRNDRGSISEAMDAKYPYFIVNGSPDYDSGTVTALFTTIEDCELVTDNGKYSEILRAWLNNGRAKLLTYYTGEAWIVAVSGVQTTDPNNTDTYSTTFNWTKIGDADNLTDYVKNGLVVTYD